MIHSTITEHTLASKDNRNLYLLEEGVISEENRGDMNDRGTSLRRAFHSLDFQKRTADLQEKTTKLKNPLFFVNPKRLLVKNLGPFVTSSYLKQICLELDMDELITSSATKQGLAYHLVSLKGMKLQLRPAGETIPTNVQIVQAIVRTREESEW